MSQKQNRETNNLQRVSSLVASIDPSATLGVDSLAKEMAKEGKNIVSFATGEPDFPTPPHIVQAAIDAAVDPKNHKYTQVNGLPELREAISYKTATDSKFPTTPDNILVTNGGKQACFQALATILGPGDEVLLPTPAWTSYPQMIKYTGATAREIFAPAQNGYKVTIDQLNEHLTNRTKAIIFVSPSNPTGAVYSKQETEEIGTWALQNNIWVISDEIYQNLSYNEEVAPSIIGCVPDLHNTCILVNGVAKSYSMTGWRVGWMVAPKDITAAAAKLQSHTTSNINNIAQRAAIAALTGPQEDIQNFKKAFKKRRDLILNHIKNIPLFSCPTPDGAFYVYPDVTGAMRNLNIPTSADFATYLLKKIHVATVPGEAFCAPGHIRLSYALEDSKIQEGLERIQSLLS